MVSAETNIHCQTTMLSHNGHNIADIQPSFHHVTASINIVKSRNENKNVILIIDMIGLTQSSYYVSGINDNVLDA